MENLLKNSNYKILNYKNDLNKLYNIIFNFCKKNNIILSNYNYNIANINKFDYKLHDINNDFNFILFSYNPKKDAINLVNEIYTNYTKYTYLNSYVFDKEITISIDNMRIVNFYLLFEHEYKIINKLDFLSNDNLLYLPNYIELFHVVHKLYNPTNFLKYLDYNYNNFNNYNKLKETPIKGYDLTYIYHKLINNLENNHIYYKNQNKNNPVKYKITDLLFNHLLNDNLNLNLILLDINAIDFLSNFQLDNLNNLYFILDNLETNLKPIITLIDNIIKKNNILSKYEITIKKSSFYIYNDFRLKKYIIKVIDNNTHKIYNIATFFNSTSYELIPIVYEYKNIKIPHQLVIIRFLLLNLISLQLFDKNYDSKIYQTFIYNIIRTKKINIQFKNIYYDGIFIDDKIDKFKLGSNIYRPWQYFVKFNKLLSIQ
jgi:hypothetical protein